MRKSFRPRVTHAEPFSVLPDEMRASMLAAHRAFIDTTRPHTNPMLSVDRTAIEELLQLTKSELLRLTDHAGLAEIENYAAAVIFAPTRLAAKDISWPSHLALEKGKHTEARRQVKASISRFMYLIASQNAVGTAADTPLKRCHGPSWFPKTVVIKLAI